MWIHLVVIFVPTAILAQRHNVHRVCSFWIVFRPVWNLKTNIGFLLVLQDRLYLKMEHLADYSSIFKTFVCFTIKIHLCGTQDGKTCPWRVINRWNRGRGDLKNSKNPFHIQIWKNPNWAQKLKPSPWISRPGKMLQYGNFCFV